ncbi:hypothetical protein [Aquimarina sp. Aq78]|uniref:hypothetical protein n=1 Tax=Aquimarina sp. Aq78 TaxID=1191889 RepID=UPI000D0F7A5E|nr:hypothetical protein [Aquimarina sp. Aq78]
MIKKLPFLLAVVIILFSCEAESFDENAFTPENGPEVNPEIDPAIEPGKIIDNYIEVDGGLNN